MSYEKYSDIEILKAAEEMQRIKDHYFNEGKRSYIRQFPSLYKFQDMFIRVSIKNDIEVRSAIIEPLYEELKKTVLGNLSELSSNKESGG